MQCTSKSHIYMRYGSILSTCTDNKQNEISKKQQPYDTNESFFSLTRHGHVSVLYIIRCKTVYACMCVDLATILNK